MLSIWLVEDVSSERLEWLAAKREKGMIEPPGIAGKEAKRLRVRRDT